MQSGWVVDWCAWHCFIHPSIHPTHVTSQLACHAFNNIYPLVLSLLIWFHSKYLYLLGTIYLSIYLNIYFLNSNLAISATRAEHRARDLCHVARSLGKRGLEVQVVAWRIVQGVVSGRACSQCGCSSFFN